MLPEDTKQRIRDAYFKLIEEKSLSPRWGQRQMVAEVANALGRIDAPEEGAAVCIIEAGTGTGKTIAYAVAAIPAALALGKKLVVATATVALQEQFVNKDLPDIRKHSGLQFDYVLAKGRRRYVCLSRLDKLLASSQEESAVLPLYPDEVRQPLSVDALPVYTSMVDSMARGEWDGDRDNWPHELDEGIWFSATTDHNQCSGRKCPNISQCSFFRARDALQNADVIVANHDLVLSDLALGGGAILSAPEDSVYVFDEGHHLPDKALNHFSAFCRLGSSQQWLDDSRKQLSQAASQLHEVDGLVDTINKLMPQFDDIGVGLKQVEQVLDELIDPAELSDRGDRQHFRLPHGLVPEELRQPSLTLSELFGRLHNKLGQLEDCMEDALEGDFAGVDKTDADAWHAVFGAMVSRAEGNLALWQQYALTGEDEDPPVARWINLAGPNGQSGYDLRACPILASEILLEFLWNRAAAVIATSATMTALNSFDRFILRSGAPTDSIFKVVESPFDYSKAVLSVPAMNADPGNPEQHTQALIEVIPDLLQEGEGSLVLFSSRRQMLDVFEGIGSPWQGRILVQGDYSKQETIRRHREVVDSGKASVIFGLASFAEGVDLPGKYCNHVLIAKIPFAVPDSPLESALSEWVESQGRNSFMEISVPDAALRLVQASGRLLRTEEDTGRVSLLDRRVVTKRYGKAILDSLPPFRREIA
jgi:ATP-dependent DNA helicase DinG